VLANLCRAELGPAERAAQTARRKAIYETLHPETKHGNNKGDGGRFAPSRQSGDTVDRFTAITAKATGRPERSVQRYVSRGNKIAAPALALSPAQPSIGAAISAN
jgi:hypothetical protein